MVAGLALVQPRVQDAILGQIRQFAVIHVGFVTSPGANYRLLAPDFYTRKRDPGTLTRREAIAYGAAALREFVLMPRPWAATSLNDIAMIPQQLIWYALVIFAVPGAVAGLRRDALVTGLLAATTLMGVAAVAPSSGNIGTLIRHRDMIVPFLVWLGALGAAATVRSCLSLVRREGK